jgi:hypothetical protein
MEAYKLLAKLRLLTLAGCEDGELLWIGPSNKWNELAVEEESILRDWDTKKEFDRYYQLIRQK